MKALLFGIAALPFVAAVASAAPVQLTNNQMDKVNAGFSFYELDVSNVSRTEVSLWSLPLTPCADCYIQVIAPLSVQSKFGPSPFLVPVP